MADVDPHQPVLQLRPQPDLARLTHGLQEVTGEVGNLVNLRPIAQGNFIVQQLQQLQQQMQQQTQQQQQLQQQMQQQTQQQQQFQQQMQQQMQQFQQQMRQDMQQFQQQMQHDMQQFQQQMQHDMQQFQQQTNLNFTNVRNDVRDLRNDLRMSRQASEHNSIARIENSGIKRPTAPLTVFRDYATNTEIPGFPATPAELENMGAPSLDPILIALELSLQGDIIDRRRRFKHYIGLTDLTS